MHARDNPFAAGRFDALPYRFRAGDSLAEVLARLEQNGMRGALVGEEGRGKTTLLEMIGHTLEEKGFRTLHVILERGQKTVTPEVRRRIADLDSNSALLLDGAEQLTWISWMRLRFLARTLRAFVITSHRGGLLPTLAVCNTSPELLESLLDELAPDRPADFPGSGELWNRHDGDIRQAMFESYDYYASKV